MASPGFAIALNADLVDDDVQRAVAESRAGREVLARDAAAGAEAVPAIDPLARVGLEGRTSTLSASRSAIAR